MSAALSSHLSNLTQHPQFQKLAGFLSDNIPPQLQDALTSPLAITAVKVLLVLKLLQLVNGALNQWSQNNWTSVGKFRPEQELVLITGGSSGIGKQIVVDLARNKKAQGVRIVILDVQKPTYDLREPEPNSPIVMGYNIYD